MRATQSQTVSQTGSVKTETNLPVIATSTPTPTGAEISLQDVWLGTDGPVSVITYYANGTKLWGICRAMKILADCLANNLSSI